MQRWGRHRVQTQRLPSYPTPTNQRAELTALVMALEWALERYHKLDSDPRLRVAVRSDSTYVVGCMNEWSYKWRCNDWYNSSGREVANRDLIEEAVDLRDRLEEHGDVDFIWVSRDENTLADEYCKDVLDEYC